MPPPILSHSWLIITGALPTQKRTQDGNSCRIQITDIERNASARIQDFQGVPIFPLHRKFATWVDIKFIVRDLGDNPLVRAANYTRTYSDASILPLNRENLLAVNIKDARPLFVRDERARAKNEHGVIFWPTIGREWRPRLVTRNQESVKVQGDPWGLYWKWLALALSIVAGKTEPSRQNKKESYIEHPQSQFTLVNEPPSNPPYNQGGDHQPEREHHTYKSSYST